MASAVHDRKNIYWIGGGSGAGKSTLARHLADRHGGTVYSTDITIKVHSARCSPDACPLLEDFKQMTMDERWADRSPEVMLETFQWFRGECFEMIIEDLAACAEDHPVFVEGFRLLPGLVEPHLASPRHAVWLLPTPSFRRTAFESRGTLWQIANKTTRPEQALSNLLARDAMFTEQVAKEAEELGLPTITVDGGRTEAQSVAALQAHFGLAATEA